MGAATTAILLWRGRSIGVTAYFTVMEACSHASMHLLKFELGLLVTELLTTTMSVLSAAPEQQELAHQKQRWFVMQTTAAFG
jgi:hypothetical protein